MSDRLKIRVIGEFKVVRGDSELALPPSKKTRALLAYLAVTNRRHRREHLCQLLWELPEDPRAALRWSLSKLRKTIDKDGEGSPLNADRDSVLLDTRNLDVDLSTIAKSTMGDLHTLSVTDLEQLAGYFRGRFLEDLELPRCPVFEGWRTFHAEALDRARSRVLRALINGLIDQPERALLHAQALWELEPTDKHAASLVKSLNVSARRANKSAHIRSISSEQKGDINSFSDVAAQENKGQVSQEVRFCNSHDETEIAYAISGDGPPILRAAHWMSHLQFEWDSPVWRHWLEAFSKDHTLVRYDERGNGLSQWDVDDLSLDAMVADLEAVISSSGLKRFPLLGVSQSCPVSVAYAVRYPQRVSHLILYGGFAQGWRKRGKRQEIAIREAMTTLIREGWGKDNPAFRQLFTETFIPGADLDQMRWFNDLQKVTASPVGAARLHDAFGDLDVLPILHRVSVPTLVIHAKDDAVVPFEAGKTLATRIPQAKFKALNSANHILLRDEPSFVIFVDEINSFISAREVR